MADPPQVADLKSGGAFRTIGEVTRETGLSAHVLRYWESRFPQLRPLTRAGNRRYYRTEDVALVKRLDRLLNHQGYTIRGVQQLLAREAAPDPQETLRAIRDRLADALARD